MGGASCSSPSTSTAPSENVTTVSVSPDAATLGVGQSSQFSAAARNSTGGGVDGKSFTWSTSDPEVVTIDQTGLATATGVGSASVRASVDGVTGQAAISVERSDFLAPFASYVGRILRVVPRATNEVLDIGSVAGLIVDLEDQAERVVFTFINADENVIGGPYVLAPDPASLEGLFRVHALDVSLLGASDLSLLSWVSNPPLEEPQIEVVFDSRSIDASGPQATPSQGQHGPALAPEDRLGYLERWDELLQTPGITDLDRWSQLVQRIVTTNLARAPDKGEFLSLVTDDMVDLFINDQDYRWWLMNDESVLMPGQYIHDPPGLTGFAPVFQNGEGRFRHFSANASLLEGGWQEPIVNLGGRILGGDFNPEDDPTGDIAADLATNNLGRQFFRELERLWQRMVLGEATETLDDGMSVRLWLLRKFGAPAVSLEITPDLLDLDVQIGHSTQLQSAIRDHQGYEVVLEYGVVWTSSDPSIATVDQNGVVTYLAPGATMISATSEEAGVSASLEVIVPPAILAVEGPASIAFSNSLGITGCPQQIATYIITNPTGQEIQWSAAETAYGGSIRFEATPGSGTLQAGESVTITVEFKCNAASSFTSVFEIRGTSGPQGEQAGFDIPVTATIEGVPGSLTISTSTSGEDLPDSYRVIDVGTGAEIGTIGINQTKTFDGVRPGTYPIRLIPVAPDGSNCTFDGSSIHDVTIPSGGSGTSVTFSASCEQVSQADQPAPATVRFTQIHPGGAQQQTTGHVVGGLELPPSCGPDSEQAVAGGIFEIYVGTCGGSTTLFNAYGPAGSIPGSTDMTQERAQEIYEAFARNMIDPGNGVTLDWAAVFQELDLDAGVLCGGRVVLDIDPDQGGRLPGFDADGMMEGFGQFTGETTNCSDFPITLDGEITDVM